MNNVIDLDAQRPHKTGIAICMSCGHDWVAMFPVGTPALRCPKCETFPTVKVIYGEVDSIETYGGKLSEDELNCVTKEKLELHSPLTYGKW